MMPRNSWLAGLALLACAAGASRAAAPLTPAELERERGGYLSVGGLSFDFGATVSTYVDGKLALQTGLTLSDATTLARQTGMGQIGGTMTANLPGDSGSTQLLQLASPSQLSNVVLNTASNRIISQNTSVTLTIPGLSALQGQYALQRLGAQLSQAAITSRLGR